MTTLDLRHVRAIVTDASVLSGLEPTAVAAYLQRTGWFQAHERETGIVWTRWIGEGAVKVFVPNDPTFADYAIRMGEVLAALARAEDRSQLAVLADLCAAMSDYRAAAPGEEAGAAGRTDWMEAEYGLRRPELALVLDLAAGHVERQGFVDEMERIDWPRNEAAELADLVCELLAAESAPAIQVKYERLERAALTLAARVDELEAAWRSPGQNLEVAAHQLWEPKARATVAVLKARDTLRAALTEEGMAAEQAAAEVGP